MRDQYNFLKAIDTSSSSPELKESHRPRRQHSNGAAAKSRASEAASSSASGNQTTGKHQTRAALLLAANSGLERAGLIRSKLQNLVKPRRFHLSSSGESKSSSSRQVSQQQQQNSRCLASQEDDDDEEEDEDEDQDQENDDDDDESEVDDDEEDNLDDSDEELEEALDNSIVRQHPKRQLFVATGLQQLADDETMQMQAVQPRKQHQQVPLGYQATRKRPANKRNQMMATATQHNQSMEDAYLVAGCTLTSTSHPTTTRTPNMNLRRSSAPNKQTSTNGATKTMAAIATKQPQIANNYSTSENASSTTQVISGRQELAKCYDEIDQIYDYIRGLAPLPANLRKIKAIDFEQIERERQRHKSVQRQQQQPSAEARQIHHLHRQRFVKSIEASNQTELASVPAATNRAVETDSDAKENNNNAKKSTKVRQRVVAELIQDRAEPTWRSNKQPTTAQQQQQQQQARRSTNKLRETLQFLVPMPIRVTTKTSESQRPSIKRVESLNLGPTNMGPEHKQRSVPLQATLEARLVQQTDGAKSMEAATINQSSTNLDHLSSRTPPDYMFNAGVDSKRSGQLFRLPRAHSTSTLNKPKAANALQQVAAEQQSGRQHAPIQHMTLGQCKQIRPRHESVIQEELLPVTHTSKRPSFESELVESFVDDDDNQADGDGDGQCGRDKARTGSGHRNKAGGRTPMRPTGGNAPARQSGPTSSTSSSGSEDDNELSASSSESDRWSYADDSSKNQRLADKSHSDYDNDSASESSDTSLASSSASPAPSKSASATTTTTTTTSSEDDKRRAVVKQGLGKEATSRRTSTGKRSHQPRPTTSSSPSSGRPASPVDMTNESDEMEMTSAVSQQVSFVKGPRNGLKATQGDTEHEEHIYEQIPSYRERGVIVGADQSNHHRKPLPPAELDKSLASLGSSITRAPMSAAPRRTSSSGNSCGRQQQQQQHQRPVAINHPVTYAANVAANRRYQQQVAALFAIQQQRSRHHPQSTTSSAMERHKSALVAAAPIATSVAYRLGHQRRASASHSQFVAPHTSASSGPLSLTVGSLKWKHHQAYRDLAEVPPRQRLSMSNIHLLSGAIPLASLCSPRSKQQQQQQRALIQSASASGRSSMPIRTTREARARNTSSLDDPEALSTGTTNSTSSYEAAIKNSEPDPLRIDVTSPPSDGEQSRQTSSRRSIGSGSGSRSLTSHNHHALQQNTANNVHQSSMLMKVPKLSKQSHLLKRPLPKPPATSRSHASSAGDKLRQPQKSSSRAITAQGAQPACPNVVDALS